MVLIGVNLGFVILLILNCFSNCPMSLSEDVDDSVSDVSISFLLITLIEDFSSFIFFVSNLENISSIF